MAEQFNVFTSLRVTVTHGLRAAKVQWRTSVAGDVYVAFSYWGVNGSWQQRNQVGIPHDQNEFVDNELVIDSGLAAGYYRLLLVGGDGSEHFSEIVGLYGDLSQKEYGIARKIIKLEYEAMRRRNGYPVWHCIPRDMGTRASNVDDVMGVAVGPPCEGNEDFGTGFVGGYFTPVLTWISPMAVNKGPTKTEDEQVHETAEIKVRMLPFPRPEEDHLIIDPATDMRYLVSDDSQVFRFRDIVPIAYNATFRFLPQKDIRYQFQPPALDTKEYRRIPYVIPR